MKIGIHKGSDLSLRAIHYCEQNNIQHEILNAYDFDIIEKIHKSGITHFFWHFHHILPEDILVARHILFSLKNMGIKVYPDFETCWFFDDKIAEKYLLESINAPIVQSWPFYHKLEAIDWLKNHAEFPIVAKLRRGAGSYNVILLKNYASAKRYCDRMFTKGINPAPKIFSDIKTKFNVAKAKSGLSSVLTRMKKLPRFYKYMTKAKSLFPQEKGYVYFQNFVEGATCDYRVVVVGNRAWGSMRKVRKNDFRASGAGQSYEDPNLIPIDLVKIAFDCTKKMNAQSMSFDFVLDREMIPHIVEISYAFGFDGGDGTFFWDEDLVVHHEVFSLEELLISNLINS